MWRHFSVNTLVMPFSLTHAIYCATQLTCANIVGNTAPGAKIMAVRKKSETIHLRVNPISKALLEGLANINGKTATQIIEDLITEAAEKTIINEFEIDEYIYEGTFENKIIDLKSALFAVQHPSEPIITKLRTYYIAPEALSSRDRTITMTILQHPQLFGGKAKIFKSVENLIDNEYINDIPDIDLKKIADRMDSLENYSVFKEKQPSWKSTYEMFLTMTEGEH